MGRSGQRQATSAAAVRREETPERPVVWATDDDLEGFTQPVAPPRDLRYTGGRTILVLCGVPGAGKTHFARRLLSHVPVLEADRFVKDREAAGDLSPDRYRKAVGDMLAQAQLMCMENEPVVVLDATAVSRRFRRYVIRQLGQFHDYAVDMIAFDATPEECKEGQLSRGRVVEEEMQQIYEQEWAALKLKIAMGDLTGAEEPGDPYMDEGFRSVVVLDRRSAGSIEQITFA